jgi:ribonuclease D
MAIHLHQSDLPATLALGPVVAVDSETMGLALHRDRLCLVQLCDGGPDIHLVQFVGGTYNAPNLARLLGDANTLELFHYARFDVAAFQRYLNVETGPVYCTKIASKLTRTYSDRHGLKEICKELLGVDLNKQQQASDWGSPTLTEEQKNYAAADVRHLHPLKAVLDEKLARLGRTALAQRCCDFLNVRATLDLLGWETPDIFAH